MAKLTDSTKNPITTNSNVLVANVNRSQVYTLEVKGTFGGGTINLGFSTDGGTTFTNLEDVSGVIAITGNKVINIELSGDLNEPPLLYLRLTGATNPSITYNLFSNVPN